MQGRKSRFWLFIWSLVPGAGVMYLGFMKMGLSLMLGFMGLIAVAAITNLGVLAIFPIAMWFYSFFYSNHLASLDEQAFRAVEDQYLFGLGGLDSVEEWDGKLSGKKRNVAAVVLIVLGAVMLWNAVFNLLCDIFGWDNRILSQIYYFVRDDLPRFVIGIAVIWLGIVMIRGKKENIVVEEQDSHPDSRMEQAGQGTFMTQDQWQGDQAEQNQQQNQG
ncbi:MAG: hypothetical protein NC416_04770 [Eubacterium sp.]|nr:hypothetical protein [Eubacterium sp.]